MNTVKVTFTRQKSLAPSPAHPTIRVFTDRIMFQNPGRFIIDPNDLSQRLQSLPRNPTTIRLFRHAKISENSGYGFDKMLVWKEKTGMDVVFHTDLLLSDVTFYRQLGERSGERSGEKNKAVSVEERQSLTERQSVILRALEENEKHTAKSLARALNIAQRTIEREISFLRKNGFIEKQGATKTGIWVILK